MKRTIIFVSMLLMVMVLILTASVPVFAETTSIKISLVKTDTILVADGSTRIPLSVELVDSSGTCQMEEGVIKLSLDRGGFNDPNVGKNGLALKSGVGNFELIAPGKPGPVLLKGAYGKLQSELRLDFAAPEVKAVVWKNMNAAITKLQGTALWRKSNSKTWRALRPKQKFKEGMVIRTGEKGWVELQLFDQSEMIIQPKTELEIRTLKADPKNPELKQIILFLATGKTISKVKPLKTQGSKFEIGTASAAAGVRGTIFETEVLANGLKVSVFEGIVDLADLARDLFHPIQTGQTLEWTLDGVMTYSACQAWGERWQRYIDEQQAEPNTTESEKVNNENPKPGHANSLATYSYITKTFLQEVFLSDQDWRMASQNYHGYGLSVKPGFNFGPFKLQLDLGFYQNPEDGEAWQWGKPVHAQKPDLPNFIDNLAYHGKKLEFGYGKFNDHSLGYGLLMADYHSSDPYHGWFFKLNPWRSTRLTVYSQNDIIYLKPFYRDPNASLKTARLEQDLFWGLQLGLTGIQDHDSRLDESLHPATAASADLTLKASSLFVPFVEVARLENFGAGAQAGITGNLGRIFNYKLSYYRSESDFLLNYYGGNYTARKEESIQQLPVVVADGEEKTWASGEMGVNLTNFFKLKVGYFDNLKDEYTISGNLSGQVSLLKMEYGYLYYTCNIEDYISAEWYLKGKVKWLGYDFRRYYNGEYLNSFKLSYRF